MSAVLTRPPLAEPEPVIEILHGVEVADPYRWLEEKDSPRTRAWIELQTQYSRAYFDSIPGREKIRKRIAEMLSIPTIDTPVKVGNRYFFLKREEHQEQPCICMREGFEGPDQVLIDPSERGPFVSVNIVNISSDGSLLAYGVRDGGEDAQAVEIFDVEKREKLPDSLPKGFLRGLHFRRNSGYIYSHEAIGAKRPNYRSVLVHILHREYTKQNLEPRSDREVFIAGESPKLRLIPIAGKDALQVAYLVMRSGPTVSNSVYLQDFGKCGMPQALLVDGFEHSLDVRIVGDQILICTDWEAPNRRILATPFEEPSLENSRTIVPERSGRIQQWTVADGKLFVNYVDDLATHTRIFDLCGGELGTVDYPEPGTSRLFGSEEQFYNFQSFCRPPQVFAWPDRRFSASEVPRFDIAVQRVEVASKDGTRVPMALLTKPGSEERNAPTILTGYGGNAIALTPQFSHLASFLVERGCRFAIANLRGGSEFGEQWHQAARGQNRQKAFDDFIAAAEWLITTGLTKPDRLGIAGGSNSGLLVSVAITQRPDLFRAAMAIGPLTDMIRYHHFGFAHFWTPEYGVADNPGDFSALYSYSPYHHIRDGVEYPAFLMISGDSDTRCNSMHARKFLARLQAASASASPPILDYTEARGHTPSLPLSFRIEALADRIAFLCKELQVKI